MPNPPAPLNNQVGIVQDPRIPDCGRNATGTEFRGHRDRIPEATGTEFRGHRDRVPEATGTGFQRPDRVTGPLCERTLFTGLPPCLGYQ
ncbi:hypothetical protein NHX12_006155 [Muraenolepis orangiensis]|uniref:Uncharacterized protein n=1 Tax=Muraenolepis orangiensis TaxID=630683 RepID=A0A9Q0DU84_9TELE|nr:hypothetical protein NHX12_006155 [Muraenolepis orangiensis]